jgi:acyl-CoA hydrolase
MDIQTFVIHHLVKGEDLNHHGTLFAGRTAEWFVEAGFIAASSLTHAENTLCLRIHGMTFTHPAHPGDILRFESKVVLTGRTRIVSYVCVLLKEIKIVEGFITFIHVDKTGHPEPHGITLNLAAPEDIKLNAQAQALFQ